MCIIISYNCISYERNLKEREPQRKEEYLRKLEHALLKKEEEISRQIRDGEASKPSSTLKTEVEKKADDTHFVKPYITPFSGTDPIPKNESSFEDWKIGIQCLIKSGSYPDYVVT